MVWSQRKIGKAKKVVNPSWQLRIGCGDKLMAKILITTIQVNLCRFLEKLGLGNKNSPELSLLKFLSSTYHHSQLLATSLHFTTFFTLSILHWGRTIFIARLSRYYNVQCIVPRAHID